jgi:hypothetical protein
MIEHAPVKAPYAPPPCSAKLIFFRLDSLGMFGINPAETKLRQIELVKQTHRLRELDCLLQISWRNVNVARVMSLSARFVDLGLFLQIR